MWAGDQSHIAFGKKFSGEIGSVSQCVAMMQQPGLLSPKFGAKSSHIFIQSPQKVYISKTLS
jgi:hypothetical protein